MSSVIGFNHDDNLILQHEGKLMEFERRLYEQDKEIKMLKTKFQEVEKWMIAHTTISTDERVESLDGRTKFMSVQEFAKMCGFPLTLGQLATDNKKLYELCRKRGIRIGKVDDPKLGVINSFPAELLVEYYGKIS